MNGEQPSYNQPYINAWTGLSVVMAIIFFGMFVFGAHLLNAGHIVWDLVRWLASPII